MKKLFAFAAIIMLPLLCCSDDFADSQYMNLAREVLKPFPRDSRGGLGTDRAIEDNAAAKKEQINYLAEKHAELILTKDDLEPDCKEPMQLYAFLKSDRIGDVKEIRNSFRCENNGLGYYVTFRIFKDQDKAKLGLKEYLASSQVRYTIESARGSKTGKRYGDLSIYTGDKDTANILDMTILYQNMFANITIGARSVVVPPRLLDDWAEKVMEKMKIAAKSDKQ